MNTDKSQQNKNCIDKSININRCSSKSTYSIQQA